MPVGIWQDIDRVTFFDTLVKISSGRRSILAGSILSSLKRDSTKSIVVRDVSSKMREFTQHDFITEGF